MLLDYDIRHDVPHYNVYKDGKLIKQACLNIEQEWMDDHVAFWIGCSFSFETALTEAGLPPRHSIQGRINSIYRTNIPLCPAGVFTGAKYVVSMQPYKASDIPRVR